MKIAILSPVWFPVPPKGYGGIEWIVSLLADGFVEAGHDVTLFASGDSSTRAELVSAYAVAPSEMIGNAQIELRHALKCFERASDFDIIHDHSGPPAVAISGAVATPTVHTVHGPMDGEPGDVYRQLRSVAPRTGLISISLNQRKPQPDLAWAANIPNGLDLSLYPMDGARDDYLLFLGRMTADKGAHRAVEVAKKAGVPLLLAGKNREPAERAYFDECVKPHLREGMIEYVGEVSHEEKVRLLQKARATLFPIDWEEPFGLVMIESMACGTPVLATRRGSVPEVIDDGQTGIIVDDHLKMADVLHQADALEAGAIRRVVEKRFSKARMVDDYLATFEEVLRGAHDR